MDNQLLAQALRMMDRRKEEEDVTNEARSALDAASSVGTETPLLILRDIRKCILDLTTLMSEIQDRRDAAEARSVERHRELIASIQQINIQQHVQQVQPYTVGKHVSLPIRSSEENREFYYKGDAISTGARIIAVILMQLDSVAANCQYMPDVGQNDAMLMDLKTWSSAVTLVYACQSTVTGVRDKIQLPKLSSPETKDALEITTSTTVGRQQMCRIEDIAKLCNTCPGVMAVVDEIKKRIIACPGLISDNKRLRLSHIKFPIVERDGSLSVATTGQSRAIASVLSTVTKFKHEDKKKYVSMVLEDGQRPVIAAQRCRKDD